MTPKKSRFVAVRLDPEEVAALEWIRTKLFLSTGDIASISDAIRYALTQAVRRKGGKP